MATTTCEGMKGSAGVVGGKIVLSQGITRSVATSDVGQFTSIPTIDVSPLSSPNATQSDRDRLVSELRDACSKVGFFVIKNHGIDWKVVEDAFDALEEFFSLPMEKKMEVHQSASPSYMGYEQPYYTNVDRLSKGGMQSSTT